MKHIIGKSLKLAALVTSCLILSSCQKEEMNTPTSETVSETTAAETTVETVTTTAAKTATELLRLKDLTVFESDIDYTEINLTDILYNGADMDVHFVTPWDDRFILISYRKSGVDDKGFYNIIDTQTLETPFEEFSYNYDFTSNTQFELKTDSVTGEKYVTYAYSRTYINPLTREIRTELIDGDDLYSIKLDNGRTITHKDGGIYDNTDGDMKELLPPIPPPANPEIEDWAEVMARKSFWFTESVDENRFLYRIAGFECLPGFGIYDFEYSGPTYVPDSEDLLQIGMSGKTVYFEKTAWDSDNFTEIFALNTETLEIKSLLNIDEFIKNDLEIFGEDEYGIPLVDKAGKLSPKLSPDGKYIAFMVVPDIYSIDFDEPYDYYAYILNAEDCSLYAKYKITVQSRPWQGIDFLGNDKLILHSGYIGKIYGYNQKALILSMER